MRRFTTLWIDSKTRLAMVFSEANYNHTMFQLEYELDGIGVSIIEVKPTVINGVSLMEIKTNRGDSYYYDEEREYLLTDYYKK